ncbi:MAG: NADH-quinone oxidoreductase subunit J [Epsilonproteobacteria bacterium]|nr:NADH-quinone oxidoreductase subunit J [Campylobacterota bacterium]
MYEFIAFYVFAISTTILFLITVMSKNVLYAMTSLAAGMVMISGFFFLLGADFLGVVQLIVYVGAVMALYAFAMMFFDATKDIKEKHSNPALVFLLGGLMALVFVVIFSAPIIGENIEALYPVGGAAELVANAYGPGMIAGNTHDVGHILFTKYLVPFELAAVMLLVAMIAGIILAGKKMDHSLTTNDDEYEYEDEILKEESK